MFTLCIISIKENLLLSLSSQQRKNDHSLYLFSKGKTFTLFIISAKEKSNFCCQRRVVASLLEADGWLNVAVESSERATNDYITLHVRGNDIYQRRVSNNWFRQGAFNKPWAEGRHQWRERGNHFKEKYFGESL